MASGYHSFTAGEEPLAATYNDYLSKQVIGVYADAATRDTAISAVLREGIFSWCNDLNTLSVYNGSSQFIVYQQATSWTPSWTNLTVGNGTVNAVYYRNGPLAGVECRVTFGSTTSVSGAIGFTLPVTALNGSRDQMGSARMFDASASTSYLAATRVTGTTTAEIDYVATVTSFNTLGATSSTVPFTWTTSDAIGFSLQYTAAAP